MAGADDDDAVWAAEFAELLARQAAATRELISLIATEPPHTSAGGEGAGEGDSGEGGAWVRSAEQLEALWRQFLQEHTEAIVAGWPTFERHLTSLLPLLSRGEPLFAILAQLLPLLAGPQVLSLAIETRGENLVNWLEQLLADPRLAESWAGFWRSQISHSDPDCSTGGQGAEGGAGYPAKPDRTPR